MFYTMYLTSKYHHSFIFFSQNSCGEWIGNHVTLVETKSSFRGCSVALSTSWRCQIPLLTRPRTDLCERRHWPDPHFEPRQSRTGWTCRVRVNNREYTCDTNYHTEEQARDKAAESAYMICRNFSVNDGMYPGQKQGQPGVVQGLPVAIGTGRRNNQRFASDYTSVYSSGSAGSSPRTSESDLDVPSRRSSANSPASKYTICNCRRAYVYQQSRCEHCIREHAWY